MDLEKNSSSYIAIGSIFPTTTKSDTRPASLQMLIDAKKILEQFNNSNTGLVVIDGKLIEKPVLREMQRKILIADKINKN